MRFVALLLLCCITACESLPDWMGAEVEETLPGDRLDVLPSIGSIEADSAIAELAVSLPPVAVNTVWHNAAFGNGYHLALKTPLQEVETYDVGSAATARLRVLSAPVVSGDALYVLDGEGFVRAYKFSDLDEELWEADIRSEALDEGWFGLSRDQARSKFIGGGIAYGDGVIIATSKTGEVTALNAASGELLWRRDMRLPLHSGVKVAAGKTFVSTSTNELYALDLATGKNMWVHGGITEMTGILGGATPAFEEGVLVAAFSSGEIFALNADNGRVMWGDSISTPDPTSSTGKINDITASPVIYQNIVYSVGNGGILNATETISGRRVWEQEIASTNTPWITGDYIFLLTGADELVCLYRPDGRIRWVVKLPSYKNEDNKKGKISWSGPVVAGAQIFLVNNMGELWGMNPADGQRLNVIDVPEPVWLPPVVVDRRLLLLSNEMTLAVVQ